MSKRSFHLMMKECYPVKLLGIHSRITFLHHQVERSLRHLPISMGVQKILVLGFQLFFFQVSVLENVIQLLLSHLGLLLPPA